MVVGRRKRYGEPLSVTVGTEAKRFPFSHGTHGLSKHTNFYYISYIQWSFPLRFPYKLPSSDVNGLSMMNGGCLDNCCRTLDAEFRRKTLMFPWNFGIQLTVRPRYSMI